MILTCKNHTNLRWNCKDMAYTPGIGYNGSRNLFFFGVEVKRATKWSIIDEDGNFVVECTCPAKDLISLEELNSGRL